jgi:quercetin dioxygenase-like cupin family protein
MVRPENGGPEWGTATEDLNATILAWAAGKGPAEHVNDERDVVVVVTEGTLLATVDEHDQEVAAGEVLVLRKGTRRRLTAGPDGVRYVSVHRRRDGITIATLPRP